MLSRRRLLGGAAGSTLLVGIGLPAIACSRAAVIRIGHLAPRAGPLGARGDHAVMGIQLAAEEINAAGGITGRRIELVLADASDPEIASAAAARLIAHDKVALLIGRIPSSSAFANTETRFIDTGRCAGPLRVPDAYMAVFARRYGKPPERAAWRDYSALRFDAPQLIA